MAKVTINSFEDFAAFTGKEIGASEYLKITQEQINKFADATLDHQWIHTDENRAATESPFKKTIAHGYLTLSLAPRLLPEVMTATGFVMGVNYGTEKVRFPSPVPVGSKLRLGGKVLDVKEIAGGAQVTFAATFEVEGAEKPSCVAEVVYRYYTG